MFNEFMGFDIVASYSIFTFSLYLNYTILSQLPEDICCISQLKIIFASISRQKKLYLPLFAT